MQYADGSVMQSCYSLM